MTGQARSRITVALGGVFVMLAVWAAAHPRSFAAALADFGPFNAHLVHDFAASSAAFGVGLVVAGRVPGWRTPMLTLAALWNGFHAVSHVIDVADAGSVVVGWAEVLLLVAGTALLAFLAGGGAEKSLSAGRNGRS